MSEAQKVLLVTGGSRGIGAAICRLGSKAGYRVAVNYASNQAAADALVAEIKATGGEAFIVKGDVGSEADVVAMFGAVDRVERFRDLPPMKRAGTADEVAGAVLYLLSDAASNTTGAILNVSGGR